MPRWNIRVFTFFIMFQLKLKSAVSISPGYSKQELLLVIYLIYIGPVWKMKQYWGNPAQEEHGKDGTGKFPSSLVLSNRKTKQMDHRALTIDF